MRAFAPLRAFAGAAQRLLSAAAVRRASSAVPPPPSTPPPQPPKPRVRARRAAADSGGGGGAGADASPAAAPARARVPASARADADAEPRYRGTTFDSRSGRWRASLTVSGVRVSLGTFGSGKEAADAYLAAKAVYTDPVHGRRYREADSGVREVAAAAAAPAATGAGADAAGAPASPYIGVVRLECGAAGVPSWEAVLVVNGEEVSGGEYESAEEAARAYDALARMYGGAAGTTRTNFAAEAASAWVPPTALAGAGLGGAAAVADAPGVPLTVAEVEAVLRAERGLDVRVLPLAGRSDLAEHMVWVTGRDARHMGRMADALARVLRRRALPGVDATVEARDMDDWMVVDAGNIIINVMDADARECFALEPMYEAMREGVDPHAGMSYDEWLEANPIPQKWLDRLARDEEELDAATRVRKGDAPREQPLAAEGSHAATSRRRTPADGDRARTRDRARSRPAPSAARR